MSPAKNLPTLSSSQSQKRRVGTASATSQSVRNRQLQQRTATPLQQQRVEEPLLDLGYLLPAECEHILAVLDRDAAVRKQEQERVIRLKKEIRDMRLRGVIRNEPGSDATNTCARCRKSFGWLFNKPVVCVICSHRVCKKCIQPFPGTKNSSLLICTFCLKQMELEAMTGHWFDVMMNKGKPGYKAPNPGEHVRASIRRSKQPTTPEGYDEVDLTNGSQVSNGGPSTRSATRLTGTSLKMAPNGTTSLGGGLDSDAEENEDIGEMFSSYAKRKTMSQTNLDRMSPFSSSKESIVSLYSNAGSENFGKYPISGDIEFGMAYNYKQSSLEVNIKQCRGVAIVDHKRNSSDPYVKTYLLPDKTKNGKRKTRVKKHTTSPVFDEVIKYHVTKSELESRTLCVMVWNFDRFGRNDFLGEVNVGFDHHTFDDPTPRWYKLQDRDASTGDCDVQNLSTLSALTYKGDLNIGLRFVSSDTLAARRQAVGNGGSLDSSTSGRGLTATAGQNADRGGELQVVVKQARNLTAVRSNGYSDPFCKCSLLPDRTRGGSQKSPVVKRNCNPVWNHTFVFDCVSWAELKERSLELTVWDYDRIISNDFLGGVRLNLGTGKSSGETVDWMDSKGEEMSLWQAMLDRPNCWIEGTLLLRLHMGQRK